MFYCGENVYNFIKCIIEVSKRITLFHHAHFRKIISLLPLLKFGYKHSLRHLNLDQSDISRTHVLPCYNCEKYKSSKPKRPLPMHCIAGLYHTKNPILLLCRAFFLFANLYRLYRHVDHLVLKASWRAFPFSVV